MATWKWSVADEWVENDLASWRRTRSRGSYGSWEVWTNVPLTTLFGFYHPCSLGGGRISFRKKTFCLHHERTRTVQCERKVKKVCKIYTLECSRELGHSLTRPLDEWGQHERYSWLNCTLKGLFAVWLWFIGRLQLDSNRSSAWKYCSRCCFGLPQEVYCGA